MLPPIVPTCRICGAPNMATILWNSGHTLFAQLVQSPSNWPAPRAPARHSRRPRPSSSATRLRSRIVRGTVERLVDPHADVGRAGDDRGIRMRREKRERTVQIGRRREHVLLRRPTRPALRSLGRAAARNSESIASLGYNVVHSLVPRRIQLPARFDDRRVAGAAAQVARQAAAHVAIRRSSSRSSSRPVIATTKPGVQKPHCEPWQSIIACCTALGAVSPPKPFDRDDVRAVELEHELDARIDWPINQPASVGGGPADEHGARAAIALAANDLRARQARTRAQIVRQRQKRVAATHFVAPAVHVDQHMVEHVGTRSSHMEASGRSAATAHPALILHYLKACRSRSRKACGANRDHAGRLTAQSPLDSVHTPSASLRCPAAHT